MDMGKNPEAQYRRYRPDYTGMDVQEFTFCTMEDLFGRPCALQADRITAQGAGKPQLVVIFVHGGGFSEPNDKRQAYISRFARPLTTAGYAVFSPDYPQYDSPEQFAREGDEQLACRTAGEAIHHLYQYLQAHSSELGLDAGRIALMGGSAGGMASFYAIVQHPEDRYRMLGNLWGAPTHLPDLHYFPPVLSIHGTADQLVPYAQALALQQELTRCGVPHRLISLEGAGHTPIARMPDYLPQLLEWLHHTMN